ncbi:hypothetical protein ACFQWH_21620 [Mycolicibacterium sp. GCM10028919]|uniref:hypothetical protein n=1 Tax=Mycolicibacterium sp. GCM10028919 TaxID=3273401 RepID=UPI00361D137D
MNTTCRHLLGSGKAVVAATALTVATTIAPPATVSAEVEKPRSSVSVSLSAASTALPTPGDAPRLLVQWVQRIVVPPSLGANLPSPQFPPVVAPTSIGSSIKNVYNSVEPWVQYGFDLAAYAVGWVPYVGWLSPQIPIFYHFGERIARSVTYNIADWIDGRVSFSQGLINVIIDTFNSFVQLGIDQWNFWLPPLPPLPPLPFAASVPSAPAVVEEAPAPADTQLRELRTADAASTPPVPTPPASTSPASTSTVADEPETPDPATPTATADAKPSDQTPAEPDLSPDRPKATEMDTVESEADDPAEPRVEADTPEKQDTANSSADEPKTKAKDADADAGDADAGE